MAIIFWVKGMSLLVGFQLLHCLRILNITKVSDYECLSLVTIFGLFFSDLHEVGVEFAMLGTETETEEIEGKGGQHVRLQCNVRCDSSNGKRGSNEQSFCGCRQNHNEGKGFTRDELPIHGDQGVNGGTGRMRGWKAVDLGGKRKEKRKKKKWE
jgi:hypothetical protein